MTAVPPVEPIKVIGMAIQEQMALAEGAIMLGLENWEIPKDKGLFVSLAYGAEQVISNTNSNGVNAQGEYCEYQDVVMLHQVDIDIMSFDSSARTRKEEILWAVQSYYAQELMEKYSMRLASIPGAFVPIQSLEPTKQLNRFQVTIMVNALHQNAKTTPYYDSLEDVLLVENP